MNMEFNKNTSLIANRLRTHIQNSTETISQGEAAAITTWWTFICDHARTMNLDPKELAREQVEAFLEGEPVKITREY